MIDISLMDIISVLITNKSFSQLSGQISDSQTKLTSAFEVCFLLCRISIATQHIKNSQSKVQNE
jgi:hypothetical protein